MLSKDDILAAATPQSLPVDVPEWGGTVYLRPHSLSDILRCEADRAAAGDDPDRRGWAMARAVARGLVDANGDRLFSEADVDTLQGASGAALGRLFGELVRLRSPAPTKDQVEDAEGNSESGPSSAS